MNDRQRNLETLLFGNPDRIPLTPGYGRESTLKRWRAEGLPEGADPVEHAYRLSGGTLDFPKPEEHLWVDERMIPEFKEEILEEKEGSRIVRDWKGNICEIGSEYGVEYLRNAIDFVTRRWIKCPVENRGDWKEMEKRYDPDEPSRIPANAAALGKKLEGRQNFMTFHFSGPYWQLREWAGFEGLSMMFIDDPALVEEMAEFWRDYVLALMKKACEFGVPDMVHISEDMAYKGYSMLSPAMVRRFLMPCWKAWGEFVRSKGIPLYAVDSDGYVGELIPLWIESGLNCCDPMEVAAGNDIVAYRKKYGGDISFRGGFDKREMAKSPANIDREMARLANVTRSGGYIPGCDHGVPSDVSWDNFVYYTKRLAETCGWL